VIGHPRTWSWRTQNLDERPGDEKRRDYNRATGSLLRHGRGWLRLGADRAPTLRVSWLFGGRHCHADLNFDASDREIAIGLATPLLALWLSVDGVPERLFTLVGLPKKVGQYHEWEREIRVAVHDWKLWWSIWRDGNGWSASESRGRSGNFDPIRVLFGREVAASEQLGKERCEVPMPEGSYPATIEWTRRSLRRARWPFRAGPSVLFQEWLSYTITPDKPIGHPGKGENAHDCGDDATFSLSGSGRNAEDAIAALVRSVLRDRMKYGGSHRFTPTEPETGASAPGGVA
jgi:hypothetical protein